MGKAPDAFRTISEVAEWLGVQAHVLRFWESKFTQIKPLKRAGGRRYYRPTDMALLGGIKQLLHEDGLTIKGAQKVLREKGVKAVTELSPPIEEEIVSDLSLEAESSETTNNTTNPIDTSEKQEEISPEPVSEAISTSPVSENEPDQQAALDLEAPLNAEREDSEREVLAMPDVEDVPEEAQETLEDVDEYLETSESEVDIDVSIEIIGDDDDIEVEFDIEERLEAELAPEVAQEAPVAETQPEPMPTAETEPEIEFESLDLPKISSEALSAEPDISTLPSFIHAPMSAPSPDSGIKNHDVEALTEQTEPTGSTEQSTPLAQSFEPSEPDVPMAPLAQENTPSQLPLDPSMPLPQRLAALPPGALDTRKLKPLYARLTALRARMS